MKKLLTSLLSLLMIVSMLLPSSALAECGCGECAECLCKAGQSSFPIAKSAGYAESGVYFGFSWWAVSESYLVIGKKAPDEAVPVLPAQCPVSDCVRGCVDNGLIREKGALRVLFDGNGMAVGLKKLQVTVQIRQEYLALVSGIVHERIDADAEMNAANIIACTNWWQNDTVSHIFFTTYSDRVPVGTVTVNGGKDVIILYAGDFNGDGTLELGFAAGWVTPPAPTPDPVPQKTPCTQKTPCQKQCKKGCINIQINLLSIVNNCVKFLCK